MGFDFILCRNVSAYYDPVEEKYLHPSPDFRPPSYLCEDIRSKNWTSYCTYCVQAPYDFSAPPYRMSDSDDTSDGDNSARVVYITLFVICGIIAILYSIQGLSRALNPYQSYLEQREREQRQESQDAQRIPPQRPTVQTGGISMRNESGPSIERDDDVEAGLSMAAYQPSIQQRSKDLMSVEDIMNLTKVTYHQRTCNSKQESKRKKKSNTKQKVSAAKTTKKRKVKRPPQDEFPSTERTKTTTTTAEAQGSADEGNVPTSGQTTEQHQHASKAKSRIKTKKKTKKKSKAQAAQPRSTADDTCSICLEDFHEGDVLRELPQCHHLFHTSCLIPWLTENHKRCPMCTTPVSLVAEF